MAFFKVDPRLATLLGEGYRSSEHALKELVDNAWDADAENVWVMLPGPMGGGAIEIRDDGTGMTELELTNEYLVIANDRTTRRGETTPGKGRRVKGRKGIGKFAGFVTAEIMKVETSARGQTSRVAIPKERLLKAADLEKFELPLEKEKCAEGKHGTAITLMNLNQSLNFPLPDRFKEILVNEYGRQSDFKVFVNDEILSVDDMPGESFTHTEKVPGVGNVEIRYTIAESGTRVKNPGLVVKVGGKVVGSPMLFGLRDDEEVPQGVAKRVIGEIIADGLEGSVTADWGAIIENSKGFQEIERRTTQHLKSSLKEAFGREFGLQKGRLKLAYQRKLESLPEYRRDFAKNAIEKVIRRFSDLPDAKLEAIIDVVLDALERDDYLAALEAISVADHSDVAIFAQALEQFGLADIALIAKQADRRLRFLDELDSLIANVKTLEKEIHQALEKNLWVLGSGFALIFSNKTLKREVGEYLDAESSTARGKKRPDLFLGQGTDGSYLLIEFKRPSHAITRDDENQARKYRDDLSRRYSNISVIVIGKKVTESISSQPTDGIRLLSFGDVVSTARSQLDWLLAQLKGGNIQPA